MHWLYMPLHNSVWLVSRANDSDIQQGGAIAPDKRPEYIVILDPNNTQSQPLEQQVQASNSNVLGQITKQGQIWNIIELTPSQIGLLNQHQGSISEVLTYHNSVFPGLRGWKQLTDISAFNTKLSQSPPTLSPAPAAPSSAPLPPPPPPLHPAPSSALTAATPVPSKPYRSKRTPASSPPPKPNKSLKPKRKTVPSKPYRSKRTPASSSPPPPPPTPPPSASSTQRRDLSSRSPDLNQLQEAKALLKPPGPLPPPKPNTSARGQLSTALNKMRPAFNNESNNNDSNWESNNNNTNNNVGSNNKTNNNVGSNNKTNNNVGSNNNTNNKVGSNNNNNQNNNWDPNNVNGGYKNSSTLDHISATRSNIKKMIKRVKNHEPEMGRFLENNLNAVNQRYKRAKRKGYYKKTYDKIESNLSKALSKNGW